MCLVDQQHFQLNLLEHAQHDKFEIRQTGSRIGWSSDDVHELRIKAFRSGGILAQVDSVRRPTGSGDISNEGA